MNSLPPPRERVKGAVARWVALALLGLAVAGGISVVASHLTSQRIGLASEPLSAGRALAPPPQRTVTTAQRKHRHGQHRRHRRSSGGRGAQGGTGATGGSGGSSGYSGSSGSSGGSPSGSGSDYQAPEYHPGTGQPPEYHPPESHPSGGDGGDS